MWPEALEWPKNRFLVFLAVWAPLLGVFGIALTLLGSNATAGLIFVIVAVASLLVAVWLWVPFVSQKRAKSIARRFAQDRLKEDVILIVTEEAKLDGQRWRVYGYYTRNLVRHNFSVIVHAKCGNLIDSSGF